jgi:DNA invertase Pin-like site-specific DNA recombinase
VNNYGYARVSTTSQDLKAQKQALIDAGVTTDSIYSDRWTGTTIDRPQFNALLEVLSDGDTLTITKIDRLARNTKEALSVIEDLLKRNINITVLNLGKIENTTIGRLIYTVLLGVAEMERDMIVERTQEGKAYAKRNNPNFKEGRPKRKLSDRYLNAIELMQNKSIADTAKITNISTATLKRIRKQYKDEVESGARKSEFNI